jgi:hypothetical protein
LTSGQNGTNLWRLTESDGSPATDPYGHIHGRRMTLTKPGIYRVGFKLFDTSANGAGGGPIHTPSEILIVYFQAGANLESVALEVDRARVRFSAPAGSTWQVETTDALGPQAKWTAIGSPVAGDDYFHEVDDTRPILNQRFYRIKD